MWISKEEHPSKVKISSRGLEAGVELKHSRNSKKTGWAEAE